MPREGQVTRRRYRGERFGGGSKGGGGLPGMKITKPNAGVQIWKPSWNKTRTVFRVFPGLDEENPGEYTPFRNLATNDYAPYMHGDWIQEITATTMGDQDRRVTFIVHDPATSSDSRNNPACKLAQSIMKAVPTGQHPAAWNTLIHKTPPSFMAPLSMPQNFWLMQGVLVEHRSKGFETATGDASVSNTIVIGHEISGNGNTFNFGKSGNVVSNTFTSNASFSRSSDLHKKTNIESTDIGLSFINELKPVTFNWKDSSEFPEGYADKDKAEMDTETNLYGMIAQDVKAKAEIQTLKGE